MSWFRDNRNDSFFHGKMDGNSGLEGKTLHGSGTLGTKNQIGFMHFTGEIKDKNSIGQVGPSSDITAGNKNHISMFHGSGTFGDKNEIDDLYGKSVTMNDKNRITVFSGGELTIGDKNTIDDIHHVGALHPKEEDRSAVLVQGGCENTIGNVHNATIEELGSYNSLGNIEEGSVVESLLDSNRVGDVEQGSFLQNIGHNNSIGEWNNPQNAQVGDMNNLEALIGGDITVGSENYADIVSDMSINVEGSSFTVREKAENSTINLNNEKIYQEVTVQSDENLEGTEFNLSANSKVKVYNRDRENFDEYRTTGNSATITYTNGKFFLSS
jgi:hypothetical protein